MAPGHNNGDRSALAMFAAELRAARAKAGLSRDALAALINYSGSLVCLVENTTRVPTLAFAQRLDEALGTPGTFERMQAHLRAAPFPAWFRDWVETEREATALRTWQPTLVDGFLQTEEYARALLSARMGAGDDEVEQMVAGRMGRQAFLHQDRPPLLWVVLDEAVLRRPIGGRPVMAKQIDHLVEMAQRPNIMIQVISHEAGAHEGVNGAFVIADCKNAPSAVYLETALTGLVVDKPEDVAAVTLIYETHRGEALPRARSLEMLKEVAKSWT
jgi:transcriptional regulator with XRE-family HTH domain